MVFERVFKLLSLTPFWLKATAWCKPGGECRQQLTCINSEGTHTSPPEQTVTTGTIAELSKGMQIYSMGILVGTHKFEPNKGLGGVPERFVVHCTLKSVTPKDYPEE